MRHLFQFKSLLLFLACLAILILLMLLERTLITTVYGTNYHNDLIESWLAESEDAVPKPISQTETQNPTQSHRPSSLVDSKSEGAVSQAVQGTEQHPKNPSELLRDFPAVRDVDDDPSLHASVTSPAQEKAISSQNESLHPTAQTSLDSVQQMNVVPTTQLNNASLQHANAQPTTQTIDDAPKQLNVEVTPHSTNTRLHQADGTQSVQTNDNASHQASVMPSTPPYTKELPIANDSNTLVASGTTSHNTTSLKLPQQAPRTFSLTNETGTTLSVRAVNDNLVVAFSLPNHTAHVFTCLEHGADITYKAITTIGTSLFWIGHACKNLATTGELHLGDSYFALRLINRSGFPIHGLLINGHKFEFTLSQGRAYDLGAYPKHSNPAIGVLFVDRPSRDLRGLQYTGTTGHWRLDATVWESYDARHNQMR